MTWRTYSRTLTPGFVVLAAVAGFTAGILAMYVAFQPLVCR
jgi:hypothetical protein